MGPDLSHQAQPPSPAMKSHTPSPSTVASKRSKSSRKEALHPSFADLPSSLVEIIMSRLVLKDNIRASAACKSWLDAGVFVRVVEKQPWLFYMSKRGHSLKLVDPLQWKSYTLELPEIAKSTVCYSRDGWLLMRRSITEDVFFFNPFTKELISLPKLQLPYNEIAFSYPPTSHNCVVVALNFNVQQRVTIRTCHPGATEWISSGFDTLDQPVYMNSKIVYLNDRFYCFNVGIESLFSFHPSSRTWKSYLHANMDPTLTQDWYKKEYFLAATKGELYLMLTSVNGEPIVYKLVSWKSWEKMSPRELDGLTFFVSFYNSELRTDLPWVRNNVCFSRFGYNRNRVTYSFDDSRYYASMEWHNELELCPLQSIWIDTPSNVLDYL